MSEDTARAGLMTQLLSDIIEETAAAQLHASPAGSGREVHAEEQESDAPLPEMGLMTQLLSDLVEETASPAASSSRLGPASLQQGGAAGSGGPEWEVGGEAGPTVQEPGVDELSAGLSRLGISGPARPASQLAGDATVGLLYDPVMELHRGGDGHFERPERTSAVVAKLSEMGLSQRCRQLTPRWATDEELLRVHTAEHIAEVDALSDKAAARDRGAAADGIGAAAAPALDSLGDMFCSVGTSAAARTAAGCVVEAVQAVLRGTVQSAMAVVRPPGHHAECHRAMGFCFFNNVAVAARAALAEPGVKRVLCLDWDVHHGNGIQHVMEEDPAIMYISLHRGNGFFPGTGKASEVGLAGGKGFTLNIPWPKGGFGDLDYLAAFDLIVEPVVQSFSPDLVIIAAGYDAVEGDPLGNMRLTPEGYGHLTARLLRLAGGSGRVVAALEGGYNVRATAECAAETVRVLLEGQPAELPVSGPRNRLKHETKDVLAEVAKLQSPYWNALAGPAFLRKHKAYFDKARARQSRPDERRARSGDDGIEIYV